MSQLVMLTAQETAERLLPVLRDYASKFAGLNERAADVLEKTRPHADALRSSVMEAARLICLNDSLEKPVAEVAQNASGLLEHSELERVVWLELKLRLTELEEHARSASVATNELKRLLTEKPFAEAAKHFRAQVERSGRYKAPF